MTQLIISQTPEENLDWQINWSSRGLGTDTIASSTWAVSDPSVTLTDASIGSPATTTAIWVTGGVADNFYTITNTIITSGGREMQETLTYSCLQYRTT